MAQDGAIAMKRRFDPGRLRHKIIVQQPVNNHDSHGGFTTDWLDVAGAWALIKPLSVDVVLRAGAEEQDLTHQIIIRYLPIVKREMRIVFGERIFEVRTRADLDETGRYMQLLTREVDHEDQS